MENYDNVQQYMEKAGFYLDHDGHFVRDLTEEINVTGDSN
jgi:hypothetical protein